MAAASSAASSASATPAAAAPAAAASDKAEAVGGLDDDGGSIKLISKDTKDFSLEKKFAFISNLVKTSMEQDTNATDIPMPGVKGDILFQVVEYMKHHKGTEPPIIEKPLRSKVMKEVCKDVWDAEFIDRIGEDRQRLYDLILAANYMDIKGLLHLGCAKVASLIKGQPLEKIKDILAPKPAGAAAAAAGATSAAAAPAAASSAASSSTSKEEDAKNAEKKE